MKRVLTGKEGLVLNRDINEMRVLVKTFFTSSGKEKKAAKLELQKRVGL